MTCRKNEFLLFFLLPLLISAQVNYNIEIKGTKLVTKSDFNDFLDSKNILSDSSMKFISNKIKTMLSDEGFYNSKISIDTLNTSNQLKTFVISIDEGNKTYIKDILINSNDIKDKAAIQQYFNYLIGKQLRRREVENIFFKILSDYENSGYPFASIEIKKIDFVYDSLKNQNNCVINLMFDKSYKSLIDKILIEGNTKTKDYVIKRNIRITEGEEFSAEKINNVSNILNRMKFFEPVESPEYYFDEENKGILKIKLKEKTTNNFDGIIGYVPAVKNKSKGFFTGFVNVGLRNIFGTERAAMFKWQKDGRLSQELEINYTEPWLFNYPININLFLWQRKEDSTYVKRKYDVKIEYLLNDETSSSLLIGYESTIPSESVSKEFTVFNSSSFILGGNLKYDTRDDAYSPTKGFLFTTTYSLYQKKIFGPEKYFSLIDDKENELQKIEFNLSYFQKIFSSQILAVSFHGRELKGNSIEISDLYKFGGAFSLRGYIENQFWGNRIFWSNLEYRYLIDKRSFVFAFFDEGYFLLSKSKTNRNNNVSGFRSGYGFGLNLETGIGLLGVSFALGEGDSFGEGKIHFGIINEF